MPSAETDLSTLSNTLYHRLVLEDMAEVAPGRELYAAYNDNSNSDLLYSYGFIFEGADKFHKTMWLHSGLPTGSDIIRCLKLFGALDAGGHISNPKLWKDDAYAGVWPPDATRRPITSPGVADGPEDDDGLSDLLAAPKDDEEEDADLKVPSWEDADKGAALALRDFCISRSEKLKEKLSAQALADLQADGSYVSRALLIVRREEEAVWTACERVAGEVLKIPLPLDGDDDDFFENFDASLDPL